MKKVLCLVLSFIIFLSGSSFGAVASLVSDYCTGDTLVEYYCPYGSWVWCRESDAGDPGTYGTCFTWFPDFPLNLCPSRNYNCMTYCQTASYYYTGECRWGACVCTYHGPGGGTTTTTTTTSTTTTGSTSTTTTTTTSYPGESMFNSFTFSAHLDYLNVYWNINYDKKVGVKCWLNCNPLVESSCISNCEADESNCKDAQACIPFPYIQNPGAGSCSVPNPKYFFAQENELVCEAYDYENPAINSWM